MDGFNRDTFEAAVDHVITVRFGWDHTIADLVKHEYTNWRLKDDPLENRRLYCQVRSNLRVHPIIINSPGLILGYITKWRSPSLLQHVSI